MKSALALQKAFKSILDADAGVGALVGDRIYDRVPPDAVLPYAAFAEWSAEDAGGDCDVESVTIVQTIRVWSRDVGTGEAKAIVGAIHAALQGASLPETDGYAFGDCQFQSASGERPEDGLTAEADIVFRVDAETAA